MTRAEARERIKKVYRDCEIDEESTDVLLDRLSALWPEPSRDSASLILGQLIGSHPFLKGIQQDTPQQLEKWLEESINKLLDWATSTEPKREWCEHIKWRKIVQGEVFVYGASERCFVLLDEDTWKNCPICGAPRPKED